MAERELVWHNTLLGREFASAPVSSAVNTLLQGTGWSARGIQVERSRIGAQRAPVDLREPDEKRQQPRDGNGSEQTHRRVSRPRNRPAMRLWATCTP